MIFSEFTPVESKSPIVLDLLKQVEQLQAQLTPARRIFIIGRKGTGRHSLAEKICKSVSFIKLEDIQISEVLFDEVREQDVILFVPELKKRREDLISIAEFYLQVSSLMYGKGQMAFAEKAKEKLMAYDWPGQLTELENVIDLAVQKASRAQLEAEDIQLLETQNHFNYSIGQNLQNLERNYILQTLFFVDQNRTKAAEILGISIRTLRNKLNQYRQEGFL